MSAAPPADPRLRGFLDALAAAVAESVIAEMVGAEAAEGEPVVIDQDEVRVST